ncbi:MAG: hypothetical protein EORIYHIE_002569 [Candidatus Fervidibacter sp.]
MILASTLRLGQGGMEMHKSLWALWAIGVAASVIAAGWRWQIERQYRTVALVVDGNEVRTLQVLTGKPLGSVLKDLRDFGATAVSVSAELLSDWVSKGKVKVEGSAIMSERFEDLKRIRRSIQRQFGTPLPELEKRETGWALPVPSLDYLSAPLFISLDREIANAAHKVGLAVVARLPNPSGLTENGLRFWVDEIRSVKAFAVVFEGEEVLGYRTMLPQVAEALRQTYCQVGIVELVSQRGDKALAAMLPERVIRVHSISARELVNFSQSELVDRFVRAVRERNIRLCYIRLPFHLKGEPLDVAREYLSTLRRELEHKGFSIGTPLPLPGVSCPIWLWLLVSLGALTTGIAFLCLFIPLSPAQQFGLTVVGTAFGVALWFFHPLWAGRLFALGVAIVAPVLAIWFGAKQTLRSSPRWQRAIIGIATCLGLTLACGFIEAAAMFDHRFWLKISEFVGVKVSQLLPFLIVVAMVASQWMDTAELDFRERYQIARSNFQSFFETPVRWGQAIGLLFLLALVAYWLMRTGNEPGLGVPVWELKLRAAIEDLLGIRPRFKEFLLGHPVLVLAFFFLAGTHLEAKIGQWLMVPAVIGLASMMNTFSHAHTPIVLSLLRTVHGIWLGIIIGVLLVFALKWFSAARDRRQSVAAAR